MPRTKRNANASLPRVSCSGILRFQCPVCYEKYIYTYGNRHAACYKRYCSYCQCAFKTRAELCQHAQEYHPESFCYECEQVFEHNLEAHQQNFHAKK